MFDVIGVGIVAAIVVLLTISLIFAKTKKSHLEEMMLKLPGPSCNILFGNALQFLVAREDMFANTQEILKPYMEKGICRLWIGSKPFIFLLKAETAEVVLSSTRILDKSSDYNFLHPWLGTGLLTSTGVKWRNRRKLITPAFHFRILENFMNVFNEQAAVLISLLCKHVGKDAIDIYSYFSKCTLDLICETAMGKSIHAQRQPSSDYMAAVKGMSEIQHLRSYSLILKSDVIFRMSSHGRRQKKCLRAIHEFTNKIIVEKREEIEKVQSSEQLQEEGEVFGQKRRLAFLDLLLQSNIDGKGLTNDDVREEVNTFMFAGHDTTASALSFTLYNIGRFPDVQRLIHEELDGVIGCANRPITSEEVKQLKYLECVIKESLRIFPVAPLFDRHINEDVDICGYIIPAGSSVVINVPSIHKDPEHFPDPEKFNPSRFLPENSSGRHPYAFIPFSAGPRNCIGQKFALMEVKVLIAHIMRQFEVVSIQEIENLKLLHEMILRPANELWLKLENRYDNYRSTAQ